MLKKATFDIRRAVLCNGSFLYRSSRLVHPPSIMTIRRFSDLPDYIPLEMPALSPTMERGSIASWLKSEGDYVAVGEAMAEVETDKATVAWESVEEGYIAKILLAEGTADVAVGTLAAVFVEEEEEIAAFKDFAGESDAAPELPAPVEEAPAPAPATPAPVEEAPAPATPAPVAPATGDRIFATPAARRVATERNIDLSTVTGTGPIGRIVKADIDEYEAPAVAAAVATAAPVAAPAAPAPAGVEGHYTDIPHTNVRKIIADRLTQSKQQIPHYYLTLEIEMDKVVEVRKMLNAKDENTKISVNDFIIKAASLALRDVPEVNSSWFDDVIREYNYVDVCVAVATDGGLITPIVQDADLKGLSTISGEVRSLAMRARNNELQPHEYQGGTFTISNLGMFGISEFTAIINPPQSCILAVGTAVKKVVVNENAQEGEDPYKTGSYMKVTLSCDHRVVDGAVGARWLSAFKNYMENPLTMLL